MAEKKRRPAGRSRKGEDFVSLSQSWVLLQVSPLSHFPCGWEEMCSDTARDVGKIDGGQGGRRGTKDGEKTGGAVCMRMKQREMYSTETVRQIRVRPWHNLVRKRMLSVVRRTVEPKDEAFYSIRQPRLYLSLKGIILSNSLYTEDQSQRSVARA